MFGMRKVVFVRLVHALRQTSGLSNSRWVTANEQVAIFLRIAVTGGSNREQQERFQRGGATITKSVLLVPPLGFIVTYWQVF